MELSAGGGGAAGTVTTTPAGAGAGAVVTTAGGGAGAFATTTLPPPQAVINTAKATARKATKFVFVKFILASHLEERRIAERVSSLNGVR
jgi:hypothetical protein